MWRKDHRIPPFAKTKTAKDGAPSCVVAPAKGGASNVGELILEFYNSSHAVGNLFISPAGALQDAKPSDPSPLNDQLKRTQDMIEETRELMKSGPLGMDSNPTNKKNGRSHLQSAHRYSLSERFKELARSVSTISEPNRVSCVLSGRTKAWSIFPQEIFGFEKILRQQSRRAVAGWERVFRAWIRIRTRA